MRRLLISAMLVSASLHAQSIIPESRLHPSLLNFEGNWDDRPLRCDVIPLKPALNFSFRFQSGFVVRVPMEQYRGKGHHWVILQQIKPQEGDPVYLVSRYALPDVPKTDQSLEVGGGYLLGET